MDFSGGWRYKRDMIARSLNWQVLRKAVALLLATALLTGIGLGSVVRAASVAESHSQVVDLAAYALPDGTVPVVCRGGIADGDQTDHRSELHCFLCVFAQIAGLPPTPDGVPLIISLSLKLRLARADSAQFSPPLTAFSARAPPIVV
ncbi:hypothetical protein [Notoacmeibacter sp. MSK16QG-6]|uniref:hypothetical protein n=1 Tax=Notoacmeibacter sp. MSK16QG-6 TaxID=2957982 RepID=UPI00209E78E1|nr:hypothetical protein [Notoacmeibacter sp. MSK16QG-6]MCP1198936.1 hypothetical protein [Notoacmeibacter sp. MSK16QG-6]